MLLFGVEYFLNKKGGKPPPDSPAICKTQMTSDELVELLSQHGINEGSFEVPDEHLPLHESFIQLTSKYSKISFNRFNDVFDRTLMKTAYSDNPLFLEICGSDVFGNKILIRRNSNDPKVYLADFHEDMSKPTVYTSSLHDYLVLSWETE